MTHLHAHSEYSHIPFIILARLREKIGEALRYTITKLLASLLAALIFPVPLYAETLEEKGRAIAQEADRRDQGYRDFTATLTMILKNKQGEESHREMRTQSLEVAGDGDKTLIIFDAPADVKGTALLTYGHKHADDDQWLYLPAVKRVKRIASSNKSGSFMGSEFSYEDLNPQEVERFNYKYLREENLDGQAVFVIERYPLSENSGYARQVAWLDKAEYRLQKVEYYDRKNSLLKILLFKGYQKYVGRHWRPAEMYMSNEQTGKSTLLQWRDYKFRTGLTDDDFSQDSLKRAR